MNKGKKLEKDIQNYFKKNDILYHRFADSHSARTFIQPQPADFIIFPDKGQVSFLEVKESLKSRFPISNFRPSQLKWMENVSRCFTGVLYYIIIKHNEMYILTNSKDILAYIYRGEKSIDLKKEHFYLFPNIRELMVFLMNDLRL